MLLASTLELAPPCWRQMLSLFLSIYHRHIITHGRRHQIHDGGSSTASPGPSTDHQRPIERGVDGSAAPVGPAFTARHFSSLIVKDASAHPSPQPSLHPVFVSFPQICPSTHTHTAPFLLPLRTNAGAFHTPPVGSGVPTRVQSESLTMRFPFFLPFLPQLCSYGSPSMSFQTNSTGEIQFHC